MTRRREQSWVTIFMVLALTQGMLYALLIPLWQAPDEPMLYEYVALTAQLGRIPRSLDQDPALEQRVLHSLAQHNFWSYVLEQPPQALPRTFQEATDLFWMPRQVGGDPPAYFVLAALALRFTPGLDIDTQITFLRLLNAALIPLLVLCAYTAAREVVGNETAPIIPLAVAAFVAFHPMLNVIDSAVGNDGLANLLAGVICWRWLRIIRLGFSWKQAVTLGLLLLLGITVKRTLLPYVLLICATGAIALALRLWRHSRSTRLVGATLGIASILALAIWGNAQLDRHSAWGWYRWGGHEPAALVTSEYGPALVVPAGQAIAYQLPAVATDRAKQAELHFAVRAWSDTNALGRLVVLNDENRHEIRFAAHQKPTNVDTNATIYAQTRGAVLMLEAQRGTIYVDSLEATSGETVIVSSNSLAMPGILATSPLRLAMVYLRIPEIVWSLSSGSLLQVLPDNWLELFYVSFWGHFGWMNVPFVRESAWIWAVSIFCLIGLIGIPLAFKRAAHSARLQLGSLCALIIITIFLPLINAIAMPAHQSTQQGRYLFPAIIPFAILIATGQSVLIPANGKRIWLIVWILALGSFALSALTFLVNYYRA